MSNVPHQPPPHEDQKAAERRRQDLLEYGATHYAAKISLGELLLPIIFALMETCWIDAILFGLAGLHFSRSGELLLPFWAPFVMMAGANGLTTYLERRYVLASRVRERVDATPPGRDARLLIGLGIIIVFITWASVYPTIFLLNPSWLLTMVSDFSLLSGRAYHAIAVIMLCVYFCRRGIRFAQRPIEPGDVYRAILLGLGIFVGVIMLRTAAGATRVDELAMLILVPLFLSCALFAHALAQMLFIRHSHSTGLQSSVIMQERVLLLVVGLVCVPLVVITLGLGAFVNPATLAEVQRALAPLGRAYDQLVTWLAYGITFLLTPLFWLFERLPHNPQPPPARRTYQNLPKNIKHSSPSPEYILTTLVVLKVVIPLLLIALLIFLIWLLLHRRRIVLVRREEDVRESVWSWELFWRQLHDALRAFWQRFSRRKANIQEQDMLAEPDGPPLARSIREVYRALLKRAASAGFPRARNETPHEFKQRLGEHLSQGESELNTITEAYTALRYGAMLPVESEVARVQQDWTTLQQKMPGK